MRIAGDPKRRGRLTLPKSAQPSPAQPTAPHHTTPSHPSRVAAGRDTDTQDQWDDVPVRPVRYPLCPVAPCAVVLWRELLSLATNVRQHGAACVRAGGSISLDRPVPTHALLTSYVKFEHPCGLYCKACHRPGRPLVRQQTWYCGAQRPAAEGGILDRLQSWSNRDTFRTFDFACPANGSSVFMRPSSHPRGS